MERPPKALAGIADEKPGHKAPVLGVQSREPNPVAAVGLESRRRRTRIVPVEPHDELRAGRDVVAGARKHVGGELVGLEFHPHTAGIAALACARAVAVLGAEPPRGSLADEAGGRGGAERRRARCRARARIRDRLTL